MIEVGQFVEVISYENTIASCGRRSEYNIGDSFIVSEITDNPRGRGMILSDNDFNFIHEDDVKYEFESEYMHSLKGCEK